jgi:GR25 family glycosyltransferase involved in LPS biosynthesis
MRIQYYLIHNNDIRREERMIEEFRKGNIKIDDVKWILKPTRREITRDFIEKYVARGITKTCGIDTNAQTQLSVGGMICTYKHYLALEDMINNNYEYGVIMEDNMRFEGDVSKRVEEYIEELNNIDKDWDILFDNEWLKYDESEIKEGVNVYLKSNEITDKCHGGTRLAQFYLLNIRCAKKLYDNYIPFNNAPDWYMNDLFRKLNIRSYWSEPSIVKIWKHTSTIY